jgi:carbamoyl-phosphate synthase small subunit
MQAILALEDGRIFLGQGHGAPGECQGEVVFNTSLTGYQEIATDPSYAGQIVVLTNPQIGNYGTNHADNEAAKPYIEGLIVREFSAISSNWRSIRRMDGTDLARVVSTKSVYHFDELDSRNQSGDPLLPAARSGPGAKQYNVVAYDFGIKQNILRMLTREGCRVTVVPAETPAADVLALKPDGVFLSNGPGDPEPVSYAVKSIQSLMGRVPVFGICLGHQLCGLALGGRTYKLKFGHHGGNHPVRNNLTGKVEITAHNHNFAVDPDSISSSEVELTHVDLNDQTLEGLRHRTLPLFSVQYHPEAAPGPHDSHYLFRDFRNLMEEWKG